MKHRNGQGFLGGKHLCSGLLLVILLGACSDRSTEVTDKAVSSDAQEKDGASALAQDSPQPVVMPSSEQGRQSEYLCRAPAGCKESILGASSPAEANWLIQNGFPSSEELATLQKLSDSQLKAKADAGSLPGLVIYGERMALGNNTKEGLDALKKAADRGSIYAYYGLSEVFSERGGLKDTLESAAYLRVAYMLGDVKASTELNSKFPNLGPVENRAIDRRAAELYKTFANSKTPAPRPS